MKEQILTNWHVVEGQKTVGVIFKPVFSTDRVRERDAIQSRVLRVDQIADLALIKVPSVPADVTIPKLGDPAQLAVGADVHAIGHPFGETWSYTKGIVSQTSAPAMSGRPRAAVFSTAPTSCRHRRRSIPAIPADRC